MFSGILICVLGAAGLLFFAWTLLGHLLFPMPEDTVTVFFLTDRTEDLERKVRLFVFLKNSGILRGRLFLLDLQETEETSALAQRLCIESDCMTYTKEIGDTVWLNGRNN